MAEGSAPGSNSSFINLPSEGCLAAAADLLHELVEEFLTELSVAEILAARFERYDHQESHTPRPSTSVKTLLLLFISFLF